MIFGACICVFVWERKKEATRQSKKKWGFQRSHILKKTNNNKKKPPLEPLAGKTWDAYSSLRWSNYRHEFGRAVKRCILEEKTGEIQTLSSAWSSNSPENRCWAHFPKVKTDKVSPFAQFQGSVPDHLCPGGLYGCCRWASAGTGLAGSTSSCKRSRTRQSPKCPGYHRCLLPIRKNTPCKKYTIYCKTLKQRCPMNFYFWSRPQKLKLQL